MVSLRYVLNTNLFYSASIYRDRNHTSPFTLHSFTAVARV
jgi:hypothetical protein